MSPSKSLFLVLGLILFSCNSAPSTSPTVKVSFRGPKSEIEGSREVAMAGNFVVKGSAYEFPAADYATAILMTLTDADLAPLRSKYPDYERSIAEAKSTLTSQFAPRVFIAENVRARDQLIDIAKRAKELQRWITFEVKGQRFSVGGYRLKGKSLPLPDGLGDHILVSEVRLLRSD